MPVTFDEYASGNLTEAIIPEKGKFYKAMFPFSEKRYEVLEVIGNKIKIKFDNGRKDRFLIPSPFHYISKEA